MRILHLTLYRKWFLAILRGDKTEEYRVKSDYWRKRLVGRDYDAIYFRNGYGADKPFMAVEFLAVKDGTFEGRPVYAIQLGSILDTAHCDALLEPTNSKAPVNLPLL